MCLLLSTVIHVMQETLFCLSCIVLCIRSASSFRWMNMGSNCTVCECVRVVCVSHPKIKDCDFRLFIWINVTECVYLLPFLSHPTADCDYEFMTRVTIFSFSHSHLLLLTAGDGAPVRKLRAEIWFWVTETNAPCNESLKRKGRETSCVSCVEEEVFLLIRASGERDHHDLKQEEELVRSTSSNGSSRRVKGIKKMKEKTVPTHMLLRERIIQSVIFYSYSEWVIFLPFL